MWGGGGGWEGQGSSLRDALTYLSDLLPFSPLLPLPPLTALLPFPLLSLSSSPSFLFPPSSVSPLSLPPPFSLPLSPSSPSSPSLPSPSHQNLYLSLLCCPPPLCGLSWVTGAGCLCTMNLGRFASSEDTHLSSRGVLPHALPPHRGTLYKPRLLSLSSPAPLPLEPNWPL